jgi:hypothetical protein
MNSSDAFFIGWDVGGWNCDKNRNSRDAIVILDSELAIIGKPWRGNLREDINESCNANTFLGKIYSKCGAKLENAVPTTLAIDTPLGFPAEFINLVTKKTISEPILSSSSNSYLFRKTERYLFEIDRHPLSAIKDMIGSQATKAVHAVAKFAPYIKTCGVWTDRKILQVIETYPAACRDSEAVVKLSKDECNLRHTDLKDAYTCAIMAYLFATRLKSLKHPPKEISNREGWIWITK